MKKVYLYRLITGELILAEETAVTEFAYTFKNPVKVVVVPSRANPKEPTVGLAMWNEFSEDKEVIVQNEHVITRTTPVKEFLEQYEQMFGSIIRPSNRLVLPS